MGQGRVIGYLRGRPIAQIAGGDGTDAATGGTPGAGGTPGQVGQSGQQPAAGSPPPAPQTNGTGGTPGSSGTQDQLEDVTGLKRALASERALREQHEAAARAAATELETLRTATQTDQERAITQAKRDAEKEVAARYEARIRRSEVRRALTAAGVSDSEIDLAALAPEFEKLELDNDGNVKDLVPVIDEFKKGHPALFGKPAAPSPTATAGGGVRSEGQPKPATMREAIAAGMAAQSHR